MAADVDRRPIAWFSLWQRLRFYAVYLERQLVELLKQPPKRQLKARQNFSAVERLVLGEVAVAIGGSRRALPPPIVEPGPRGVKFLARLQRG